MITQKLKLSYISTAQESKYLRENLKTPPGGEYLITHSLRRSFNKKVMCNVMSCHVIDNRSDWLRHLLKNVIG